MITESTTFKIKILKNNILLIAIAKKSHIDLLTHFQSLEFLLKCNTTFLM